MDNFFLLASQEVFTWHVLLVILIGTIGGIICGAIPGFSIAMGIILVFPFSFSMDPISGLALMNSVVVGGYSGGLVAGIMLGIPGTPSSITTVYDGFPMAKRGEPGRALGIGITSSFLGTVFSIMVLAIAGPLLAKFGLNFGPWEITMLIILALTIIGSLSEGSLVKGMMSGVIGLFLATTGVSTTGEIRFSFGIDALNSGLDLVPVLIGVYAFSQMLENVEETNNKEGRKNEIAVKIPYGVIFKDIWKQKLNLLRSSFLGSLIGAIPGIGGTAANFLSYDQARKFSKQPQSFGKGNPAGIAAAESSNNAVIGGTLVPTLTLGIPGNLTMAILMGVLILHGITPGPRLFSTEPVLIGSIYVSILVSAFIMFVSMILLIKIFAKIALIPPHLLVPVVLLLTGVGSFALNNTIYDVWVLFFFGIVGYLFHKSKVPLGPLVIGMVLGEVLEENLFRALQMDPNITTFFTRPISGVISILAIATIFFSIWQEYSMRKKYNNE